MDEIDCSGTPMATTTNVSMSSLTTNMRQGGGEKRMSYSRRWGTTFLEFGPEDVLALILSYLDFRSATRLSFLVSISLKERIFPSVPIDCNTRRLEGDDKMMIGSCSTENMDVGGNISPQDDEAKVILSPLDHHWKQRFHSSLFALPLVSSGRRGREENDDDPNRGMSYHREIVYRRRLFQELHRHHPQCGSDAAVITNRPPPQVHFVPKAYIYSNPDDDDSDVDRLDVNDIDLFVSTFAFVNDPNGCGDDGTLVVLDPFHHTIRCINLWERQERWEGIVEKKRLAMIKRSSGRDNGEEEREEDCDMEDYIFRRDEEESGSSSNALVAVDYAHGERSSVGSINVDTEDMDDAEDSKKRTTSAKLHEEILFEDGKQYGDNEMMEWMGIESHPYYYYDSNSGVSSIRAGNIIASVRTRYQFRERAGRGVRANALDPLAASWIPQETEVLSWKIEESGKKSNGTMQEKMAMWSCTMDGTPYHLDICGVQNVVYASICPRSQDIRDNGGEVGGGMAVPTRTRRIKRLALLPRTHPQGLCDSSALLATSPVSVTRNNNNPLPFPDIICDFPVSSFALDGTGTVLIVGTELGRLEVWDTTNTREEARYGASMNNFCPSDHSHELAMPRRVQEMSVEWAISDIDHGEVMGSERVPSSAAPTRSVPSDQSNGRDGTSIHDGDRGDDDGEELNPFVQVDDIISFARGEGGNVTLPSSFNATSAINQIIVPHSSPLSLDLAGFLTVQGTPAVLGLWQKRTTRRGNAADNVEPSRSSMRAGESGEFQLISLIHPRGIHVPRISFNGRKLLVHGKDTIGPVIYLYRVLGTQEDRYEFDAAICMEEQECSQVRSGGAKTRNVSGTIIPTITSMIQEARVKLVNVIRHPALQHMADYELSLAANERYIVVNSNGYIPGSECDGVDDTLESEGLVVIDTCRE